MRSIAYALAPALIVVTAGLAWGCVPEPPPDVVQFGERNGLAACDDATIGEHPDSRCFTWRGLAGVSMGGGTAARLGFSQPDLFDVVGVMGTPFADTEFFFGMLETNHMSGFCSKAQLEAAIAAGVDLDDPNNPDIWCGTHDVYPLVDGQQARPGYQVAVEGSQCAMFSSDFNHWYRGPDEGRGGTFNRNGLIEIVHDLVAAFGNTLYHNDASLYFPPGVDESTWYLAPHIENEDQARAELCATPKLVPGVKNAEYNPDGTYDAVTFCDGTSDRTGDWNPADPRARSIPVEFAVALDMNGNGRKDYAEPIIINNRERWRDLGEDGLADVDEPGYDAATNPDPARDNFDTLSNAEGKEGNLRRDDGEDFDDNGLDGVAGTADFGEGNGTYDIAPSLQRSFERSPARFWNSMSEQQIARLDVWMDAGIRDFLNTGQISNALFASLKQRAPDAQVFNDFTSLPGVEGSYIYHEPDYSRDAMGQIAYLRYGDPSICPDSDDILGDGNHVGPDVVNRLYTLFSFMSARMPAQGRTNAIGGDIADMESPTGRLTDFAFMTSYASDVLGKEVEFGVMLPPDYFLPEATETRYPVLYFFHGQGQDARGMSAAGLALWPSMKESARDDRFQAGTTDLQRSIVIWVDGNCYGDECWTGNFYADFEGLPDEKRRFESQFYELVRHVEAEYRAKTPELIPLAELQ